MTVQSPVLQQTLERLRAAGPDAMPDPGLAQACVDLLDEPAVAGALVEQIAALDAEALDRDPAPQQLLEHLLDEARRRDEDGKPEGGPLLTAAADACAVLSSQTATGGGVVALGGVYHRAGLAVPEALKNLSESHVGDDGGPPVDDPDQLVAGLVDSVTQMIDEADGDLFGVFSALQDSLATLPDEGCAALIHHLAGRRDAAIQRLCLYWVVEPRPALAHAAVRGLADQARAGALGSDIAGCLAWLRPLLAETALREGIDAALAAHRRRVRDWPRLPRDGGWDQALASIPDGVGAQYVALGRAVDGGKAWSMTLIKAGHGLRDAYVLRDLDDEREQAIWSELSATIDFLPIDAASVHQLLGAALAESLRTGHPPPPGLLDVALENALADLRPQAIAGRDWLAHVDPAGMLDALSPQKRGRLINASGEWGEWLYGVASWFEDSPGSRAIVATAANATDRQLHQRLRAYLDTRREHWAELCLRSAVALRAVEPDWLSASFALTGAALLEGRELRRIPLVDAIIEATIDAGLDTVEMELPAPVTQDLFADPGFDDPQPLEELQQPSGDLAAARPILQRFFEEGEGARLWSTGYFGLCGYMFGVVIQPDMIVPSEWLTPLVQDTDAGIAALADADEMQNVVSALANLYASQLDALRSGERLLPSGCAPATKARENMAEEAPIRQWARGFALALERLGDPTLAEGGPTKPGDDEVFDEAIVARMLMDFLVDPERTLKRLGRASAAAGPDYDQLLEEACTAFEYNVEALAVAADKWQESASESDVQAPRATSAPVQPARSEKVGRNELCPCGSGRKYKRCCGNRRA